MHHGRIPRRADFQSPDAIRFSRCHDIHRRAAFRAHSGEPGIPNNANDLGIGWAADPLPTGSSFGRYRFANASLMTKHRRSCAKSAAVNMRPRTMEMFIVSKNDGPTEATSQASPRIERAAGDGHHASTEIPLITSFRMPVTERTPGIADTRSSSNRYSPPNSPHGNRSRQCPAKPATNFQD